MRPPRLHKVERKRFGINQFLSQKTDVKRGERLFRLVIFGDFRNQFASVKVDFIAPDFSFIVELHKANANAFHDFPVDRDSGQPFVQKPIFHGNRFDLRPYPIRILGKKLFEVREKFCFPSHARRNCRIKVKTVVRIKIGQFFGIVAGPGRQPS